MTVSQRIRIPCQRCGDTTRPHHASGNICIPCNERQYRNLVNELAYHNLRKQGFKILLRDYECVNGEIDFIAKESRTGELLFIGVNRLPNANAAKFYMKRYNVSVDYKIMRVDQSIAERTPEQENEISTAITRAVRKIGGNE